MPVTNLASFQYLLDSGEQTIGVQQHEGVELFALLLVEFSPLQRLKIKPDGSDGRLQFVSNGVDEAVMLLVAPNLANQEERIQDKPGADRPEEDEAEENLYSFAPIENDPTKADGGRHRSEADPQRSEKNDRLAPAGNAHFAILQPEKVTGSLEGGAQSALAKNIGLR